MSKERKLQVGEVLVTSSNLCIVNQVKGDIAYLWAFLDETDPEEVPVEIELCAYQEPCGDLDVFPSLDAYLREVKRRIESKLRPTTERREEPIRRSKSIYEGF